MIKSIQQTINAPEGIDYELLEEYIETSKFKVLEDIDELRPGWQFKYLRIVPETGKYKFVNSWFCLANNEDYILFKWWDHSIHSLQKNEVIKMWYKDFSERKPRVCGLYKERVKGPPKPKKEKVKPEKTVEFHPINHDNKYEVFIGNKLVFKGRDRWTCDQFMKSVKYKKAIETGRFKVVN